MFSSVPEDWIQTTLGQVCTVKARIGWRGLAASEYTTNGPHLVAGKHIKAGRIDWSACDHLSDARYNESPEIQLRIGDVVISKDGSIGNPALIESLPGQATINGTMMMLRPVEAELFPGFLFQFVNGPAFSRMVREKVSGSSIPHIFQRDIVHFPVSLPPFTEQRRISDVLRSVDEAIAASESAANQLGRVIEQEATVVIGSLFAEETARTVTLGEVALVKGGKRLPKGSIYEEISTPNRYIRVTDWADYQIDASDVRYISDEVASSIRRYTISSEDLFISIAGSIGLVASVPPELDGSYLTENAAKIIVRDKNTVDATYLLVALRSELLAEQIRQQKGVGGGVPKLALFRIEELRLPLPEIRRQREIAANYLSLKAAREKAVASLNAAVKLKVDLAADLLSGRVRVPA